MFWYMIWLKGFRYVIYDWDGESGRVTEKSLCIILNVVIFIPRTTRGNLRSEAAKSVNSKAWPTPDPKHRREVCDNGVGLAGE